MSSKPWLNLFVLLLVVGLQGCGFVSGLFAVKPDVLTVTTPEYKITGPTNDVVELIERHLYGFTKYTPKGRK